MNTYNKTSKDQTAENSLLVLNNGWEVKRYMFNFKTKSEDWNTKLRYWLFSSYGTIDECMDRDGWKDERRIQSFKIIRV